MAACDRCLARPWLLRRLASHLERVRARIGAVLELEDHELVRAVAGEQQANVLRELGRFDASRALEQADSDGLELICRCDERYPSRLRSLKSAPAVLHIAGGLNRFLEGIADEPVGIVGARKASPYGIEVARRLGRELRTAGLPVISGMAMGIDSAAHKGAIEAGQAFSTVAVLPGVASRPYPAARRLLHRQIVETGAAISELPPGAGIWRWMFPARNRIIAALGAMTVVVEAGERSGALTTASNARRLGRALGAVPGRVTSPQAAGSNALLAAGAYVVRGAQDVLDVLFGAGVRSAAGEEREPLAPELRVLLAAVADGHDTAGALARAGIPLDSGLQLLAMLELSGHVRRQPGGRFTVVP